MEHLLEEYERLVVAADDLLSRLEICERLAERVLIEVGRGEQGIHEAYYLLQRVIDTHAELLKGYYHVRLQKTVLARLIGYSQLFN